MRDSILDIAAEVVFFSVVFFRLAHGIASAELLRLLRGFLGFGLDRGLDVLVRLDAGRGRFRYPSQHVLLARYRLRSPRSVVRCHLIIPSARYRRTFAEYTACQMSVVDVFFAIHSGEPVESSLQIARVGI